jgi:hypothetical protein
MTFAFSTILFHFEFTNKIVSPKPNLLAEWIRTALPLTSPSATFLYGPLDAEVKEKEKKQIVRHKDVIEERKKLGKVRTYLNGVLFGICHDY